MCSTEDNLNICLKIDEKTIYDFHETINESSIVRTAKEMETLLIKSDAKPSKIQNVYEILVEVMQNILNYSYGNRDLPNNKKEANGTISLSYDSINDTYILQSCNLIEKSQEEVIEDKLFQVEGLDDKALRKLARKKMRSREDNHEKGAGLGFIVIARKCSEPIERKFYDLEGDVKKIQFKFII